MTLYYYLDQVIGERSFDWYTFILFRSSNDLKIRTFPNTAGLSVDVLKDLIQRGTNILLVKIDGKITLKTDPETWLWNGIVARLTPSQEPHAFLKLSFFEVLDKTYFQKNSVIVDITLKRFL